MCTQQGGQAVGLVVAAVSGASDPEEAEVQQPRQAGEHALAHQPPLPQVLLHRHSQMRQTRGHLQDVIVLGRLPQLTEPFVIQVLAPAGRVRPHGLDVPAPPRADPAVGIRSRRVGGYSPVGLDGSYGVSRPAPHTGTQRSGGFEGLSTLQRGSPVRAMWVTRGRWASSARRACAKDSTPASEAQ